MKYEKNVNKSLGGKMLSIKVNPKTENLLKIILSQYENEEDFAHSIIDNEVAELKKGIINTEIDLRKYEKQYKMSSKDFYEKFTNGKLGDEEDFIIWSGIYEMKLQNKQRLQELE